MTKYKGLVSAEVVEVRFPVSGKLAAVYKKAGDQVAIGQALASLEKKFLQAELDRRLAGFEKVRADFDIFDLKFKHSDDITKFTKTIQQADLNSSIKEVEIAKSNLDQTDLYSPVAGIILEDSGCRPGLYITPSSISFKIQDSASFMMSFEVSPTLAPRFLTPRSSIIHILGKKIASSTLPVRYQNSKFIISAPISDAEGLLPGLVGIIDVT